MNCPFIYVHISGKFLIDYFSSAGKKINHVMVLQSPHLFLNSAQGFNNAFKSYKAIKLFTFKLKVVLAS
jgi:hypothetical protein